MGLGGGPPPASNSGLDGVPPWLGAAAHVFVADLGQPRLSPDDEHHLARVLRLRAGEEVTASDGAGGWRRCRFQGAAALESISEVAASPAPVPAITVGFALTKGERPEWTVQKLVEAGVDRIFPLTTARTVLRWDAAKGAREVARLRTVALGAAMQSRRVWLPAVEDVTSLRSLLTAASGVAMAQVGGRALDISWPTVVVGPEGGWDEAELALGLPQVSLGPSVLRSETAAMAAGLLLCALRSGVVRSAYSGGSGGPGASGPGASGTETGPAQ